MNGYAKATVQNIGGFVDFLDYSPSVALDSAEEAYNKLFDLKHSNVVFPTFPCNMYSATNSNYKECSDKQRYIDLLDCGYIYYPLGIKEIYDH